MIRFPRYTGAFRTCFGLLGISARYNRLRRIVVSTSGCLPFPVDSSCEIGSQPWFRCKENLAARERFLALRPLLSDRRSRRVWQLWLALTVREEPRKESNHERLDRRLRCRRRLHVWLLHRTQPQTHPLGVSERRSDRPGSGTACELGFGQGVCANIHAAASGTRWFGTDFNPAQAGFARALATASGAGAQLVDLPFAEFCARGDLPDFDYIGVHGIWSWISDENRAVIVDFVRRKLAVGGVLYVSYNTQPGWAAMVPLRDLLTEHAEVMGAPAHGIVRRIEDAMGFAEKVMATNPAYARANPQVAERLTSSRARIATIWRTNTSIATGTRCHCRAWPSGSTTPRFSYACSAIPLDPFDVLNVTADQRSFFSEIPDPMFRQTVRDFMVNQQFRRDYWVRGARRLNVPEQAKALRATQVLLAQPRADVNLKVTGSLGEATLQEAVYAPILDALASHQPLT